MKCDYINEYCMVDEDDYIDEPFYEPITCETCPYIKKKEVKKIECPFFKTECVNYPLLCDECFDIDLHFINYFGDEDEDIEIYDEENEDIITFVNFDIEDLPF